MLKAVFFDLDGTLLYSLRDIGDAMNYALADMGLPVYPIDDYKLMIGDGVNMLCLRAAGGDKAASEKLLPKYRARYSAHLGDSTKPYDGVPEALASLRAENLKLFVLSNKPDADTKATIARYFEKGTFEEALGQRPEFAVKPDPASAKYLLEKHSLDPAECAMVGDSRNDMLLGENAGLWPVGALWGYRDRRELLEGGAKLLMERPDEIAKLPSAFRDSDITEIVENPTGGVGGSQPSDCNPKPAQP